MKNIHVLPTDKPSRVVISKCNEKFYLYSIEEFKYIEIFWEYDSKNFDSQNIYITSDEEIKEGDYVFDTLKNACPVIRQLKTEEEVLEVQDTEFKIILTTDKDLIKDGVQAIDDEFLEWFVKNPSCEEVVFSTYHVKGDISGKLHYKIIIPKEEPKQETLEEAAISNYKRLYEGEPLTQEVPIDAFKRGYRLAEKQRYTVEEVIQLVEDFKQHLVKVPVDKMLSFKEWFETFKNK